MLTTAWNQRLSQRLAQQQQRLLRRSPVTLNSPQGVELQLADHSQPLINFSSNDYLGLAAASQGLASAAKRWGLGSGASHLVCGHSQAHEALQQALAQLTGYPAALVFSSGYQANLGVISALTGRGDRIYQDKLNHASLMDAARLSLADHRRYPHGQLNTLQQLLQPPLAQPHGLKLVATDAVFSMDGDLADLAHLSRICEEQQALLMIDDAHGLGVLGQGAGSRAEWGLTSEQLPVYMGTLGKALGGFGAFVAGSEQLIDYLKQFCRTHIYTTALPPALCEALLQQLPAVTCSERQQRLASRIQLFLKLAQERQLPLLPSRTPIQPLLLGDNQRTLQVSQRLKQLGFLVIAIRPPSVPPGQARLRITLSAAHEPEHLFALMEALDVALAET